MRTASAEVLEAAFERAAGRDCDAFDDDPLVRAARGVVLARRALVAAEPCPSAVLHRVNGFLATRPRGAVGRLLALVFDSATAPLPALRGASRPPRTIRYSGGGATVDFQVRRGAEGQAVLHVAVQPPRPGLELVVRILPQDTSRKISLDDAGSGEMNLPPRSRRACASVRDSAGEAFRTGSVSLD